MAIGNPNGIPFCWEPPVKTASDIESSPNLRISADGGVSEFSNGCLDGRVFSLVQASPVGVLPSLLVVPQSYKSGKLYAQLPNARVNHIPNNSMFGASGGVIPSGWTFSVGAASGVSLGYSASGQVTAEDGTLVDYIDFTFSGTATASGFLNLRPNASPSTIASVSGQSWNASVYLQLISGSVASISPTWQLQETTSGGTFIDGSNITGLGSLTTSLPLRRYNVTRDLNTSGTVVTCRWGHSIASGTSYNYILRIASPQLENLSSPTSVIRTVSGAVYAPYSGEAPGGSTIASIADFTVSRNTTATRVNSSGLIDSVASGVPRIDWLGQSCPGLLVEASGQNLAINSADFTASGTWASGANTISANVTATLDPAGTNTAEKIIPTAVSTTHFISSVQSIAITSGTTYTVSVFAKAGGYDFLRIAFSPEIMPASNRGASFNLTSGTVGDTQAGVTARIENYGNGWYRCSISRAATTSTTPSSVFFFNSQNTDSATSVTFTGDGTSGAFLWGAQLEAGSIATTYIPTTTAAVSRAADVISASGALVSGLIGQTEGTMYAEVDVTNFASTTSRAVFYISDGSMLNYIRLEYQFISPQYKLVVSLVQAGNTIYQKIATTGTDVVNGTIKIAFGYSSGNNEVFQNGAILSGNVTGLGTYASLTGLSKLNLGSRGTDLNQFNDRIRAAALYTTRLTDAQLAELTRL